MYKYKCYILSIRRSRRLLSTMYRNMKKLHTNSKRANRRIPRVTKGDACERYSAKAINIC